MAATTWIEWTDATWNPIRGCSRVSEGCRNCYAERVAYRFSGKGQPYEGLAQIVNGHPSWTGKVMLAENRLLDPLKWKPVKLPRADPDCGEMERAETRPRRIFVNSMSDLFHENVRDEWIDRIFAVMALCPQHTFQILTKRPERTLAYSRTRNRATAVMHAADVISSPEIRPGVRRLLYSWPGWPLPNVHHGVSVEDQKTADERIPLLLRTPAAARFISAEPLLGAIDLWQDGDGPLAGGWPTEADSQGELGMHFLRHGTSQLDWLICGGESGPGARPMHPDWARSLRDQCQAAGVPFFFKQWGEWGPVQWCDRRGKPWLKVSVPQLKDAKPNTREIVWGRSNMERVGKKAAGSLLDGREWKEFPR